MKLYLLAVHNLKLMIQNGNKLFFIILFSISMSVFGILFYSGYFLYAYYQSNFGSFISIVLKPNYTREELCQLIKDLTLSENRTDYIRLLPDDPEEAEIIGEYNSNWNHYTLIGNSYSLDETNGYVVMEEYLVDFVKDGESPIGMTCETDGLQLEICGIVSYTDYDCYMVPVYFYASNYDTEYMEYAYQTKLSVSDYKRIRNLLNQSPITDSFHINDLSNPFLSSDFMNQFLQIMLIFAAIIINVFCMSYYWIIHFKRNYRIFAVCGAGKRSIIHIILVQTFLLMLAGVFTGNILFLICRSILKNYDLVYQDTYFPYIVVSLTVIGILMLFSLSLAKKATKTNEIYHTME